jgi:hypothetical protein
MYLIVILNPKKTKASAEERGLVHKFYNLDSCTSLGGINISNILTWITNPNILINSITLVDNMAKFS